MNFHKPKFTVNEIGKLRFSLGILIGLGYAITLNLLFKMFIRISNFPIVLEYKDSDLFFTKLKSEDSLFLSWLALSLAFCMTTYLWMRKPISKRFHQVRKWRYAQTNSFFIFMLILYLLGEFYLIFLHFNSEHFDLDIKKDFGYLHFFLPIFVFLYNWMLISKTYNSKMAVLVSSLLFPILGFLLSGIYSL